MSFLTHRHSSRTFKEGDPEAQKDLQKHIIEAAVEYLKIDVEQVRSLNLSELEDWDLTDEELEFQVGYLKSIFDDAKRQNHKMIINVVTIGAKKEDGE